MYIEYIRAMHVIYCAFRCIFPRIPTVDAGIDTHISFRCCCLYRHYFIVFVWLSLCDLNAMCIDLCRKWLKMKCVSCWQPCNSSRFHFPSPLFTQMRDFSSLELITKDFKDLKIKAIRFFLWSADHCLLRVSKMINRILSIK